MFHQLGHGLTQRGRRPASCRLCGIGETGGRSFSLDAANHSPTVTTGHTEPSPCRRMKRVFPLPVLSVLLLRISTLMPSVLIVTSATCKPSISERRRPPAKPRSKRALSRLPGRVSAHWSVIRHRSTPESACACLVGLWSLLSACRMAHCSTNS